MRKAASGWTFGFGDAVGQPKTPSHVGAGFRWTRRGRPANLKGLPRKKVPPLPLRTLMNQGLARGRRVQPERSASACRVTSAAANCKQP